MHFTLAALVFPLVLASPIPAPRGLGLGQLIPDLPAIGIPAIRTQILGVISALSGSQSPEQGGSRANVYGDALNKYTDFDGHLHEAVGDDNVNAIDVLADRLCIAGANQGSLCNELFSYAYAWYVAQQKGWTYQFVAESLGANNMKQIGQAINTLCLQPADDETAKVQGVCQRVGFQTDQLANSIVGEQDNAEDNANSNSLVYFGLQNLLPKPSPLGA